jgi:hypothetical protein
MTILANNVFIIIIILPSLCFQGPCRLDKLSVTAVTCFPRTSFGVRYHDAVVLLGLADTVNNMHVSERVTLPAEALHFSWDVLTSNVGKFSGFPDSLEANPVLLSGR